MLASLKAIRLQYDSDGYPIPIAIIGDIFEWVGAGTGWLTCIDAVSDRHRLQLSPAIHPLTWRVHGGGQLKPV